LSQSNNYKIHILLAVWGEKFINDFFQLSLPSLLAAGNIPALAKAYNTKFIFLTKPTDVVVFRAHPIFQKLKSICEVDFISIEDLIVLGNYSTTLTFAYDRAIKQAGEEMLNTYFIFLTSDYIMANGSFQGLMRYIEKGYSGICAGNFQVVKEDIEPFLRSQIDVTNNVMEIGPRQLMERSLQYLHPIVIASLFEQGIAHNYYANRFFLRYSFDVMAGRFYLLHMLCIKPELINYKVGSSCDYSFIPEMCPSGNVGIIDDSDDYFVVEIQSRKHELNYVNGGPYVQTKLVHALAEWTTKRHRQNANHTIYFHTRNILPAEKIAIDRKLNTFIDAIGANLNLYKEKPYHNHPYWIGAIDSFYAQQNMMSKGENYEYFDLAQLAEATSVSKKAFYCYFGKPPNVFPWHHRWLEYCSIKQNLQRAIVSPQKTIVMYDVYQSEFMRYCSWLKNKMNVQNHFYISNLITNEAKCEELRLEGFDTCILFIMVEDMKSSTKNTLSMIKKILASQNKVLMLIPNQRNYYSVFNYDFPVEFAYKANVLIGSPYHIADLTMSRSNMTMLGAMLIYRINKLFSYNKKIKLLLYILLGVPSSLFFFIRNCLSKLFSTKRGHCTNILVTLVPDVEVES